MNIGIVTPYDSANYGAYLQAYASMTFLHHLGHNVFFIQWRSEIERKKIFFPARRGIIQRCRGAIQYTHRKQNYKQMTEAIKQFDIIDIKDAEEILDLVVIGSDEVWNVNIRSFQNPVFWGLSFSAPVLAYAPSMGNAKLSDFSSFPEYIHGINKINIIGVRDENTSSIVSILGSYMPEIVCDPTLLCDCNDYQISNKRIIEKPYLLVYAYNIQREHVEYIKKYAKAHQLKTVSVCMRHSWCDYNICVHPLEFISMIRDAECVYTTTFHGSIFTLMQHKKCCISAKSKKVQDLLSWTGMSDVVLQKDCYEEFSAIISEQQNYDIFEKNVSVRKNHSIALYKNALIEGES